MNTIKMSQTISHDTQLEKVLYTGETLTTCDRAGASRSSDVRLDVRFSSPAISGSSRAGRKEIEEKLMKARHYLKVSSWIIGKQRYSITK
jgi:hypothetical protein